MFNAMTISCIRMGEIASIIHTVVTAGVLLSTQCRLVATRSTHTSATMWYSIITLIDTFNFAV